VRCPSQHQALAMPQHSPRGRGSYKSILG
jgi:hypothetical protein